MAGDTDRPRAGGVRGADLETLELRPWSKRGGGMLACKEWASMGGGSGRCPFVYPASVSSRGGAAGMRGVPNAPDPPKPAW